MNITQRQVICNFGKTGTGKTTVARSIVKSHSRVIVIDPRGFNEFDVQYCSSFAELLGIARAKNFNGAGFFRLGYSPKPDEYGDILELAAALNRNHAGKTVNQCLVVIEEAHKCPSPKKVAEYDDAISLGRHFGVNLLAISLYPAKVPIELRSQATQMYLFMQHQTAHVKALRGDIGDAALYLSQLERFQFLHWHETDGTRAGRVLPSGEIIMSPEGLAAPAPGQKNVLT